MYPAGVIWTGGQVLYLSIRSWGDFPSLCTGYCTVVLYCMMVGLFALWGNNPVKYVVRMLEVGSL